VAGYIQEKVVALRFNTVSNTKMAKPPTFDRDTNKVVGFIKHIYTKRTSGYMKENKLKNLESRKLEFLTIEDFLTELKIIWQWK